MDAVQTFCTSSLLEETGMSSSSSFFDWHSLSCTSSPSALQAVPMTTTREKLELVGCNPTWALEQTRVSQERCLLIIRGLCTWFDTGDTKEYIWGVLIGSCPLSSEFLPSSFHLISLWDLGWVKTGLWRCGKRQLLTEEESREPVDAVYASTWRNTLRASDEPPVSPGSGRPMGYKAAGSVVSAVSACSFKTHMCWAK